MTEFHESTSDHYHRLGLVSTATQEEIQTAYTKLHAEWQELARKGDEQAPEQLRLLDEAYTTLADPNRRAAYDRSLRDQASDTALVLATQPTGVIIPDSPAVPILERQCPHCRTPNPIQITVCQNCGGQISRPCPQCGQPVSLNQAVCPRCNVPVKEYDKHRFAEATHVNQQVQHERREAESRHRALEAMHKVMRRQGVVFWLAVMVACATLTAIAIFVANLFNG